MIKLISSAAAALLLTGTAFAATDSIVVAQNTRAEVKAEAKAHPPAAGLANATSDAPKAASSKTRAEVKAEARKSKPAAGLQSDVGTTAPSNKTRAEVRQETREAVKAGDGPATNATTK
ncbi:hypothetical protein [Ottowia sp.]|uniref:hypothetical protein n=1 Tax=Ottowia sp. TaxID=1898956 RepID=UPI003A8AD67B